MLSRKIKTHITLQINMGLVHPDFCYPCPKVHINYMHLFRNSWVSRLCIYFEGTSLIYDISEYIIILYIITNPCLKWLHLVLKTKHGKGVARLSLDKFDIFTMTKNAQLCTVSHALPFWYFVRHTTPYESTALVNKEQWAFAN